MKQTTNGIIYGLSYFTSLPFKVKKFEADDSFYRGVLYSLPISGFLLSILSIICYLILPFNSIYSAFVASIIYIFLYGMLHLEAVGDTIDGYYASLSCKNVYEIMHEPQIGALGAMGAFCLTLLKLGAITYTLYLENYIVLIFALTLSRLSVWFSFALEFHEKSSFIISLKKVYKKNILIHLIFIPIKLITRYILNKIKKQLGFLNGDILGFTIVINEILFLNIGLMIC